MRLNWCIALLLAAAALPDRATACDAYAPDAIVGRGPHGHQFILRDPVIGEGDFGRKFDVNDLLKATLTHLGLSHNNVGSCGLP